MSPVCFIYSPERIGESYRQTHLTGHDISFSQFSSDRTALECWSLIRYHSIMKIKVEEYICPDGSNPYKAWFDNLDPQAAAGKTEKNKR